MMYKNNNNSQPLDDGDGLNGRFTPLLDELVIPSCCCLCIVSMQLVTASNRLS